MDWLVVEGIRPWDGRYEFDVAERPWTTREWGWIKRLTGYLPLTLQDGWSGGDPELFAVFAVIALRRAGKIDAADAAATFERIADAQFGTIRFEAGAPDGEDDARPPPARQNGNTSTSGGSSPTSSGRSAPTHPDTGIPASGTSESGPLMSKA